MVNVTDIDLPLSEIISKKRITLRRPGAGGIVKAKTLIRPTVNRFSASQMAAKKVVATRKVIDARNRIILNKRRNVTDARDTLAQMAKTGDARDRLVKIRSTGAASKALPALMQQPLDMRQKLDMKRGTQVKKITSSQHLKTGRLQLSKASGQTRMQGNAIVRTVSGSITSRQTIASRQNKPVVAVPTRTASSGVTRSVPTGAGGPARASRTTQYTTSSSQRSNGLPRETIREFHSRAQPVRQQTVVVRSAPQTILQRPAQVDRRPVSSSGPVYVTRPRQTIVRQQPQTIYREVPAMSRPRPAMPQRYQPQQMHSSSYDNEVVVDDGYQHERQPTVVYRTQEPMVYEEPMEYQYEVAQPQQDVYYERTPSPFYEQEPQYVEDLYTPQPPPAQQYMAPVQQQSRPAPYAQSYSSRPPQQRIQQQPRMQQQQQPRMQQQQPRMHQQQQQQPPRMHQQQQPRMHQQQPRMQQQQPRVQQPRFQQARPQPLSSAAPRAMPVRQQPQQTVRRSAPVARQTAPVRAPATPKVIGHKVSVSNLHPVASHEDIEELFGNIGPISSSKMQRPGVALVVFNNLSDAHKSVEVYHNRKLDGQPMQVKIVGPATDTVSTPTQNRNARLRGSY